MAEIGKKSLLYMSFIAIGAMAGFFAGLKYEHSNLTQKYLSYLNPIRESDGDYKYIKPLLAYKIPPATDEKQFQVLYDEVNSYVEQEKKNGNVDDLSLFFSELDKGRWIGINENQKYTPASLMKVVLMMAYLKKSEENTGLLNQKILYSKVMSDLTQTTPFDTLSNLKIDNSYTISDLIKRVIVDSDNGAKTLLLANIDDESLDKIFEVLHLPNDPESLYAVSPRDYSLFFRVLYGATYLNKQMSEKALTLLSQTTFNDGLKAGLPAGIMVANKFGEHILTDGSEVLSIELHDCGITYYQPSPYFICIMTRGNELDKLESVIKRLSELVYKKISQ